MTTTGFSTSHAVGRRWVIRAPAETLGEYLARLRGVLPGEHYAHALTAVYADVRHGKPGERPEDLERAPRVETLGWGPAKLLKVSRTLMERAPRVETLGWGATARSR